MGEKTVDNKRFSSILTPGVRRYLLIIFIFNIIMAFYNHWIALIGLLIYCYLLYYNARSKSLTNKAITKYIENLTFHVDSATKDTLLHFPLPMVVLQLNGIVAWYNSGFSEIFGEEVLLEKPIQSFVEELQISKLLENQGDHIALELSYGEKYYRILGNIVKIDGGPEQNYLIVLYWIDNTQFKNLTAQYQAEKNVQSIIMIDNYDEVMQSTDDVNRPQVLAEIDRKLTQWAAFTNGLLRKFERDKYIFIFENKYLNEFEEKKFDILDTVKEINVATKIPVTLSIGIGLNGSSILENHTYARAAIDIALGRGGDQVVINEDHKLRFFGGQTKELEKRTRVKARVVAYALRELILQAEQVMIMGHQNADMDVIGAAIGLYRGVRSMGKDGYIVLGAYDRTVNNLLSRFKRIEEYDNVFINKNQAMDMVTENTLLIVVDTHRTSFTECPELLTKTNHIVLIDHHRRGAEFIENTVLTYHETYASSTCEMVTEILQYLEEKVKLNVIEAEALYAGIAVDTKHFTFKTGVRTFEAASFLRRAGMDTVAVKQLFQSDLVTFAAKADIIKAAKIYRETIAISVSQDNIQNAQMIIAQSADELLNIIGITASFVMCKVNEEVIVSGRSLGDINVQVILEKLGGGGHLTVAGAQLSETSPEDARKMIQSAIDKYFEETDKKA